MQQEIKLTDEILLTIPQAAFLMHTDINRVRNLIKAGHIKALKLGELKVRRTEIDRFLQDAEGKDYSNLACVKDLVI